MNPRQGVLISMFVAMAIYLLANAQSSVINARVASLKQPTKVTAPTSGTSGGGTFGGGTSGSGTGGAGGGF
jgi:Mn2+/Fe2+ NRAMP family transporter